MPHPRLRSVLFASGLLVALGAIRVEAQIAETPLHPATLGESSAFGGAVAIEGSYAYVGAAGEDLGRGSVYVFVRSGAAWQLAERYRAPGLGLDARFGAAIAVSGTAVVVGTPGDRDGEGSVRVLEQTENGLRPRAVLRPTELTEVGAYGGRVSIDGGAIAVSAPLAPDGDGYYGGAVLIYRRVGDAWALEARLERPGAPHPWAIFGWDIAISGERLLVSSLSGGEPTPERSGAWIFEHTSGTWTHDATLLIEHVESASGGFRLDLDGDTAVLGAPNDQPGGSNARGAVYVFERAADSWARVARLQPPDIADFDRFGSDVALSGQTLVAGSSGANSTEIDTGRVSVFVRTGGAWTYEAGYVPVEAERGDRFGDAVAVDEPNVLTGAPGFDDRGVTNTGGAYTYTPPLRLGAGCRNDDGCDSGFCVDGVCCESECGGGDPADCMACGDDGQCAAAPATHECRPALGDCDLAERCDGASLVCPDDERADDSVVCRGADGGCDTEERCDGSGVDCPSDQVAEAGLECRAADGECDRAEACDGLNPSCPRDAFAPAGEACGDPSSGECDAADTCDAAGICRPRHALDGEACDDGAFCTAESRCRAGACEGSGVSPCDEGSSCDEGAAMCVPPAPPGPPTPPPPMPAGCAASPTAGAPSAPVVFALLGLALARRRKRSEARHAL